MIEEILNNPKVLTGIALSLTLSVLPASYYLIILLWAKYRNKNATGYLMQIVPPKYSVDDSGNKQGYRFILQKFIDNIASIAKNQRISFEIFATDEGIKFLIWTPTKELQRLIKLNLYTTYKERIIIKDFEEDIVSSVFRYDALVDEYRAKKHYVYSLFDVNDFSTIDPVNNILGAMTDLYKGQSVLFQMVIKPTKINRSAVWGAKQRVQNQKSEINWLSAFLTKFYTYIFYFIPLLPILIFKVLSLFTESQEKKRLNIDKDDLNLYMDNIIGKYDNAFSTYIRVAASGNGKKTRLGAVKQALNSMNSDIQNRLVQRQSNSVQDLVSRFLYPENDLFPFHRELFTSQRVLTSREISMLFHLPKQIENPAIEHFSTPNIPAKSYLRSKVAKTDLLIGVNQNRDREYNVFLHTPNRARHLTVLGQTGTGKSTILKNFVLQDIDNRLLNGQKRGLMMLDPHEDFFVDIIKKLPPQFQPNDLFMIWDTRSDNNYIGFNPLYAIGMSEREIDLVVDSNYKLIEKIFKGVSSGSMGVTSKPMLMNAMKTLMIFQTEWLRKNPGHRETIEKYAPTLLDLRTLFLSEEYLNRVLSVIDLGRYETLRSFWQDVFPKYREGNMWKQTQQSFDNRIAQMLTGILFYTFAQSKDSINLAEVIRKSKILLVNVSSKNIGMEGMSLLGSLLMAKTWFEAKKVPEEYRKPFSVYADEFQNFATSDFSQVLSEGRKFKLELVLAHQFFGQLPTDVLSAVMGNVKSKVYYRVGLKDAAAVSEDLQGLILKNEATETPEFHANVKIGKDIFSIYVPEERADNFKPEFVEEVVNDSYRRLGRERSEIEEEIKNRKKWVRDGCKPE